MTTDIKEPSGDIMEIPSLIRRILHSSAYGCLRTDDRTALTEYILDVLRMRNNGFKHLARAEKAEAECDRLAGEVVTLKASLNEWVRENAPGGWIDTFRNQARERDRLKAALVKFLAEADNAPKRMIGSGIGGQTMEATLQRAGRLVSEWQLGQLEEALGGDA